MLEIDRNTTNKQSNLQQLDHKLSLHKWKSRQIYQNNFEISQGKFLFYDCDRACRECHFVYTYWRTIQIVFGNSKQISNVAYKFLSLFKRSLYIAS